ncbi:MAG TPA: GNAT family N-acetyltransferase [Bacteroidia bacterium]|nr:GNAT family N-acetyltransferase [Bacteroidia bacterium]
MITVHIADTPEKLLRCKKVLFDFRPQLNESNYMEVLQKLHDNGSVIVYTEENEIATSVAIFETGFKIHRGNYLYIDDLATLPEYRNKGYAAALLNWIELYARDRNIDQIHLDSGVHRHDAHRLYLKRGYIISGHHFVLKDFNNS